MPVSILSGYIAESRKEAAPVSVWPVDPYFTNPSGHNGTIEHEEELRNRQSDGPFGIKDRGTFRAYGSREHMIEAELPAGEQEVRRSYEGCFIENHLLVVPNCTKHDCDALHFQLFRKWVGKAITGENLYNVYMDFDTAVENGVVSFDDFDPRTGVQLTLWEEEPSCGCSNGSVCHCCSQSSDGRVRIDGEGFSVTLSPQTANGLSRFLDLLLQPGKN